MSYGEIYILQNSDGSWLLEEDFLPGSLEEAMEWEAFGKRIGRKLTEIALLNQQISDETRPLPVLTLVHTDARRGRHAALPHRSHPSSGCPPSSEYQIALAWQAIRADIRDARQFLTEDQEPKRIPSSSDRPTEDYP